MPSPAIPAPGRPGIRCPVDLVWLVVGAVSAETALTLLADSPPLLSIAEIALSAPPRAHQIQPSGREPARRDGVTPSTPSARDLVSFGRTDSPRPHKIDNRWGKQLASRVSTDNQPGSSAQRTGG
ncbi:hypothetical protein GCM10025331_75340 [Actinoplanes utahensis]|nr:hypothetical protein Aut01nite_43170 [Actinoplanes utahensis]